MRPDPPIPVIRAVLIAFALALAGCSTAPKSGAWSYEVPGPVVSQPVAPAKSSPIRIVFQRPEARDVHP